MFTIGSTASTRPSSSRKSCLRTSLVDEVRHLRVLVHDPADAVADVLRHHAEAGLLDVLLHLAGHLRPPLPPAHLDASRCRSTSSRHLRPAAAISGRTSPIGSVIGRVGAPAVELAGGVDLEQVAVADDALAGDAVDHLFVERDAGDGGERHLRPG